MKRLRAAYHFVIEDEGVAVGAVIAIVLCALLARGAHHPGIAALLLFAGIMMTVAVSLVRATSTRA